MSDANIPDDLELWDVALGLLATIPATLVELTETHGLTPDQAVARLRAAHPALGDLLDSTSQALASSPRLQVWRRLREEQLAALDYGSLSDSQRSSLRAFAATAKHRGFDEVYVRSCWEQFFPGEAWPGDLPAAVADAEVQRRLLERQRGADTTPRRDDEEPLA